MLIGKIVFYLPRRGYGFIASNDGEQFFFHASDFLKGRPKIDFVVRFERTERISSKGKCDVAINVERVVPDTQTSDLDILAGKGGAQ